MNKSKVFLISKPIYYSFLYLVTYFKTYFVNWIFSFVIPRQMALRQQLIWEEWILNNDNKIEKLIFVLKKNPFNRWGEVRKYRSPPLRIILDLPSKVIYKNNLRQFLITIFLFNVWFISFSFIDNKRISILNA